MSTRFTTIDEYTQDLDKSRPAELLRGEIVQVHRPYPRHGQICARTIRIVGDYAEAHQLGHVIGNDSGIVTSHHPDTVRGGDVWFVSYRHVAPGALPHGYLDAVPDLVFEVKAPTERWSQILAKIAEYLSIGIDVVCVLDPEEEMVRLYYADQPEVILAGEDPVTFPDQLPGFKVSAHKFFT